MLTSVFTTDLRPNPFRRLAEYPIIREKIDALKESINSTGFWGTIVGRPHEGKLIEIAFGHHRLQALNECKIERVEIIVRDLSNEQMLKMMARENLEEWGTSAWVEIETIRSTIDAYGNGLIELPKVSKDTRKDDVQSIAQRTYTRSTVAEFLGWTRKRDANHLMPNYACETAFKALDMIDAGFLREADLKGLKRSQLGVLVTEQWAIYGAEKRIAKNEQEQAERVEELAKDAPAEEQRKLHKRAAVHREQSRQHEMAATAKAKVFGKEAADLFRADRGRDAVKERAAELRPIVERPVKVHSMDDLLSKIAKTLESFANGEDDLSQDFRFAKKNWNDSSEQAKKGLSDSFLSLIDRLERMRAKIDLTPRSHSDGTRGLHVTKAITQNAEGNGRSEHR